PGVPLLAGGASAMSEQPPFEPWEDRLHEVADAFSYPPTPDLATQVSRRLRGGSTPPPTTHRLRWVTLALIVLMGGMLAVPEVRAKLRELLHIGAVQIEVAT